MSRCHSGLSHEEVGKALGVSRTRVQQIERSALDKLRVALGSDFRGKFLIYDTDGISDRAHRPRGTGGRRGLKMAKK